MARHASTVAAGLEVSDMARPAPVAAPDAACGARAGDIERLIGGQASRWWVLAGSWLAVAFSVGFGLYVNYQAQGEDVPLASALMAMIPHYFFWVLVSPPLYRALHRAIEGGHRLLRVSLLVAWSAIALVGSTAMSYFSYIVRHDLRPSFGRLIDIYILPPAGPAFWAMNFSILALALAALAVVRSQRLRDQALWSAARTQLRGAQLEAQLAESRFQALQAQINPHFVLNSLNAIAVLVQSGERARAFDALGRLGELMQLALRGGREPGVTLGDEIDFLRSYLTLCELRFGSSLEYCISMPESLRSRKIPALIVQPLVENAMRHGMLPSRTLHIGIRIFAQGAAVVIEVEDDGSGISADRARDLPPGHGLANVSERLRLYFGASGALRVSPAVPSGTCARIVIGGPDSDA